MVQKKHNKAKHVQYTSCAWTSQASLARPCSRRYMLDSAMRAILLLFVLAFTTQGVVGGETNDSLAEHAKSHAELEIKQRDVVISEMGSILLHQYKGVSKAELVSILRSHSETDKSPDYVSTEGRYVFFGSTVKFEFKENRLINVYW
jgi:hypothetical protein